MNSVHLMGRLTGEPELRQTANGVNVADYTLAVDRGTDNKGESITDFIRCVAWDKRAEFASRYLHKGMKILIEGCLTTGSYDDKDGKKVYWTKVMVNKHYFCEKRNDAPSAGSGQPQSEYHTGTNYQPHAHSHNSEVQQWKPQPNSGGSQQSFNDAAALKDFEEVISEGDLPF